jgi:hypothetical protein
VGRHNRRREPDAERPLPLGMSTVEEHPDGDWVVRRLSGTSASSANSYRCPGCDQVIPAGTPHVVAWPADRPGGESERRHWHATCWSARGRRTPNTLRSRNAPRY